MDNRTDKEAMLLRLGIKDKIKTHIENGASFRGACIACGVPAELVLNLTKTDSEFRGMYELAKETHPVSKADPAPSSVPYRDPHAIKQDFMSLLVDAGLYHKLAQMAALADPETEEGQKVLMFMGRSILPLVTPKDEPVVTRSVELEEMSDVELKLMLKEMREARLEGPTSG